MTIPRNRADDDKAAAGIDAVQRRLESSAQRLSSVLPSDVPMRRALDSANGVGAWDWDIVTDRVYANARFATLCAVDPARARNGMPIAEFMAAVHPEDAERVGKAIEITIASDAPLEAEYRVVQADGGVRWLLVHGRCKYDADGKPLNFPGSAIEITERKRAEAAQAQLVAELRGEKARLQAVLDHVPFGIVFAEAPSGQVVSGNQQVERILGHPVMPTPNLEAHGRWVAYHEDGRIVQAHEFPLARAITHGEVSGPKDFMYRRGDGTLAWVQLSAAPIRDGDDRIVAGVVSIADIDRERRDRKRQAALIALNDRLRDSRDPHDITAIAAEALGRALGASRVGYAHVEPDLQQVMIERDWCDFSADSIVGRHRIEDFGAEYVERLRQGRAYAIEDVTRNPGTQPVADRFQALGIRAVVKVPLLTEGQLRAILFVHDSRPRNWSTADLSLIREVSDRVWAGVERARATTALQESEMRFRAITESMPQMVWSTLPDGHHDFYNQRWYDFTGTARSASDGADWNAIIHPEDQPRASERWRHSLATGAHYEIEYRLRRHDGVYRWVLGRAVPVRNAEGVIQRWFGTCTDIDDQVQARELLARDSEMLEREVVSRTAELQQAYERLSAEMTERERTEERLRQSQKMEAVGQLTGGIAHDFNNLMTGIIGSLGQMRKKLEPDVAEELDRYLDIAQTSADRAASLTHRLLAFSRRQSLDTRAIDVLTLVRSMEELLSRTLGENVQLEVDTSATTSWLARADENQLENALLNLVINARDAMPHGGRLSIGTGDLQVTPEMANEDLRAGDYVMLSVSDSGAGMPADVMARAFDPFFTTKPLGQGTGLGLSMVYGFVRQIGGHVRIESVLGRGTTVRLYLPRDTGTLAEKSHGTTVSADGVAASGGTILVVEDDDGVRALVTELLAELGFTVLEAADGVSGLAIAAELSTPIDLLLTDVGLPGMNGRHLADAVRQHRPGLKILFMTGYAETAIVRGGFLGSGMSMMTKPFTLDALVTNVRRMFAEPVEVR
jgi:PAS domain S-box-containing protein